MKRKQYIVFDMDGVIFNSERLIAQCWQQVGAELEMEGVLDTFLRCVGTTEGNTRRVFQERYPDLPYPQFQKRCADRFFGFIQQEGMPLKPGARELLQRLREADWSIGLASSTRMALVKAELEGVGLWHYFDQVITGDQLERSKPAPDIYRMACRALGVWPEHAWAVEDSYNGIRSAASAGIRAIMVPDLLPPTPEMEQLSTAILPDLDAVGRYFGL